MTTEFGEDLAAKLRDLEAGLQTQMTRSPSTYEKAAQHERQRPLLEQVSARSAELRDELSAALAAATPLSPDTRRALERKWSEIERLLASAT